MSLLIPVINMSVNNFLHLLIIYLMSSLKLLVKMIYAIGGQNASQNV